MENALLKKNYERDGYLVIKDFFSKDRIDELASESERLLERDDIIDRFNLRCRFARNSNESSNESFDAFDPVTDISDICKDFAFDCKLKELLSTIYGEPPYLFKDKIIFKNPGSNGYPLHQDWISWSIFPESFLTVIIPISRTNRENGCIEVFKGHHKDGYLCESNGNYNLLPDDYFGDEEPVPLELDPGDIGIFSVFTPHKSSINQSEHARTQLLLSYNASSDGGNAREKYYHRLHRHLSGSTSPKGQSNNWFFS